MFSKDKVEKGIFGESYVKSQKGGERSMNDVEANFYKEDSMHMSQGRDSSVLGVSNSLKKKSG